MTARPLLSAAAVTCSLLLAPGFAHGAAAKPAAAKTKAAPAAPDEKTMMEAMQRMGAVGENQKRLETLVGEWTTETKMWMAPGQPPMSSPGTNSNRMLMGGRYLQSTFKGDAMGEVFEGLGTMGYDNLSGKYVTTWFDSMTTGIFYTTGAYDPATKTITTHGSTPDPIAPKTLLKVRTTTRFVDADTYVFEWYETHGLGKEAKTLEVSYKRTK
jgi:Protein of unknown function (DUF1579)